MKIYFEIHYDENFHWTYDNVKRVDGEFKHMDNKRGFIIKDKGDNMYDPFIIECVVDLEIYKPTKKRNIEILLAVDEFVEKYLRKHKLKNITDGI